VSAWLKVARANDHLRELQGRERAFFDLKAYMHVQEQDSEVGDRKSAVILPPPEDFGLIIGDIVHNLRSALDHIIWSLSHLPKSAALTPKEERAIGFPIVDSAPAYTATMQRHPGPLPPNLPSGVAAEVALLQPHHGWNNPTRFLLWVIQELDRIDKHRLVVVTTSAAVQGVHGVPLENPMRTFTGPIKSGTVVPLRPGQDGKPEMDMDLDAPLVIAFDIGPVRHPVEGFQVEYTLSRATLVIAHDILPRFARFGI